MNGYIAFYDQRRLEIYADDYFKAKEMVLAQWKVPLHRRHLVTVLIAEKNGEQVEHSLT